MKKLALAIMLGLGVMVSGCGNTDTATHQQTTKVECGYTHGDFGSYTASNPVQLDVGKQFGFNGAKFDTKGIDGENKKLYGVIIRDGVGLYEIDVNNAPQGWDKLENSDNVYQVDEVVRGRALVGDLVDEGIYPMEKVKDVSDLLKFVDVTTVKAHIVHHHTKECK